MRMSGKQIKDYIVKNDDVYYNIIVLNERDEKIHFNYINDDINYEFEKIDEIMIGSGMVLAYYRLV